MTLKEQLIAVTEAYCALTGLSTSHVSKLALNDGKRLPSIAAGGDIATGRFEVAMQWFSNNWPPDAEAKWPSGVVRPALERAEAAQ